MGRVLGRRPQVLVALAVLVLGEVRGVARRRRLGMVDAGPEVREGDLAHFELEFWGHLRPQMCRDCMWAGGGTVRGMEGLERCLRKSPGPEPETTRRARTPTGEVGAESSHTGAVEEPYPAGAEAMRRVAVVGVLVVDPESDMGICLGGARGYDGRGQFARERRAPYKVVGVAISVALGHTLRYSHFGGRNFVCGLVCMGNRAWVRGSYKI